MTSRLWYPQLDVFDTVRRISVMLQKFDTSPGPERLYIVDFYLANPPLLHRTSMSADVRKMFSELRIPKPEKTFITYPSALLLFHKMEVIQKEALNALSGKGLVSLDRLKYGRVELTSDGKKLFPINKMCTEAEEKLCNFLAGSFAKIEEVGNYDLRRRTGLRRSI